MKPLRADPTVAIVVWSGPLSALAARLNLPAEVIRKASKPEGGQLVLDVEAPTVWPRLRMRLRSADE